MFIWIPGIVKEELLEELFEAIVNSVDAQVYTGPCAYLISP
jgi:hypothetical protein